MSVQMYQDNPCCRCIHRCTDPNLINTTCLACRHAYFSNTEAYEQKADLFEEGDPRKDESL